MGLIAFIMAVFFFGSLGLLLWLWSTALRHQRELEHLKKQLQSLSKKVENRTEARADEPDEKQFKQHKEEETTVQEGLNRENLVPETCSDTPEATEAPTVTFDDLEFDTDDISPAPDKPEYPAQAMPSAIPEVSRPVKTNDPAYSLMPAWLTDWFTEGNLLVRIGTILIFVGAGFLFKYAVDHAYLPIWLRMTGVALGALTMIGLGQKIRDKRPAYGLALQGGGLGLLYLTVYASLRLYALLPASIALPLLALISASGVITALRYDARWLAVISFAGGFLAPLLASTGSGNHVALFAWYAVLNVGIAVLAYYRSWREMNLLGLIATFILSAMWGHNFYRPEMFNSVEPFLIGFTLLYLVIGMMFTLRRQDSEHRIPGYVDASLIFATPVGFLMLQTPLVQEFEYGLSISTFIGSLVYATAALFAYKRKAVRLSMSLAVIAASLLTLTIPLAFNEIATASFWALEGIGLLWLGLRQRSVLSTLCGLALQLFAALAWFQAWSQSLSHGIVNSPGTSIAALLIALSAWSCVIIIDRLAKEGGWLQQGARWLQFWGLLWWLITVVSELNRHLDGHDLLLALVITLSATAWLIDQLERRLQMHGLGRLNVGLFYLWIILLFSDHQFGTTHPLTDWGWVAWSSAIATALILLNRAKDGWALLSHFGLAAFFLAFTSWEYHWLLMDVAKLGIHSVWGHMPLALAALSGLLLLLIRTQAWPFSRLPVFWLQHMAGALLSLLALWSLLMLGHDGYTGEVMYMPLLNPIDAMCLASASLAWLWRRRLLDNDMPTIGLKNLFVIITVLLFLQLNVDLARIMHHWFGIAWDSTAITHSAGFQPLLSIGWSLVALALMLGSSRLHFRWAWIIGASLLGIVVIKLFLVDLSGIGTLARIVSFLGVGVLMLLIGYVAPMPPEESKKE